MTFARSERAALCDLLEEVGPDAPTLCSPWDAHDLAAHLWIRETDPLGASGILAKPLAGLTERRMADTRRRWEYGQLLDKIRKGPARFSVYSLPGVDEPANTTEFFVHHEDVRRASAPPLPPRVLDAATEDWMWRRLKLLGRAMFRSAGVGVVLERQRRESSQLSNGDSFRPAEGDSLRVLGGSSTVTVVGRPSELMLFASGRMGAADVALVGEPVAVRTLATGDRRI